MPTRWEAAPSHSTGLTDNNLSPKELADQKILVLADRTTGTVYGEIVQIESFKGSDDFTFQLNLVGKGLNNYRFKVMTFSHTNLLYPVFVRLDESISHELKMRLVERLDAKIFEEFFEKLLKSVRLSEIMNSILRQSSIADPVGDSAS